MGSPESTGFQVSGSGRIPVSEQLLHRIVQRFRGGLVFEAHRLGVSLNSRLETNKEEEEFLGLGFGGLTQREETGVNRGGVSDE